MELSGDGGHFIGRLRRAPAKRTFAGTKYDAAVYQLTATQRSQINGRAGGIVCDYWREILPALQRVAVDRGDYVSAFYFCFSGRTAGLGPAKDRAIGRRYAETVG